MRLKHYGLHGSGGFGACRVAKPQSLQTLKQGITWESAASSSRRDAFLTAPGFAAESVDAC